ncbi:arginine--tRNA ligase [Agrococcus terreus]|uniref:Arginine--tRNA ligase n=1 Tax=Agrococcus terreus TaxID=574649 RepID=A0ABQ2KML6_9MICO|nr:arginine--tRNA ligase [Agrococcus terreus]GGN86892.1 arginine--tRNA ligase [Agrococcus terreus]
MQPSSLSAAVLAAVRDAVGRRAADVEVAEGDIVLERPRQREHGDWATNAAMRFAKRAGVAPRELAEEVASSLAAVDGIERADVAGPGFINLTLAAGAAGELARTILEAGDAYGSGDALTGVKVNLEFVSANPTGPIHMGGTRWAAVGDSLGRVLERQGALVTREYYFNDHGGQIDRFARSLVAAFRGEPTPEDGYGGAYIAEIARRVDDGYDGDLLDLDDVALQEAFRARGVALMFEEIKQDLHEFGVDFDVYFHEHQVQSDGSVDRAIEVLRERGHVFEEDGALWLRTTSFGDDKDRVVIRSNGMPAYFSGDLGYYQNKRDRGFDQCIIMLGADHHGYVGRMMAMCAAFGDTPHEHLEILIGQMVNLIRDGQPMRMSKRAGTIVTMEDLVDAVGVDAARYALVRSSADTPLDIDLELLTQRTNDNPVYYVQYAHARMSAVARNAAAAGVDRSEFDPSLLTHPSEAALLGALADFPRVLAQAAELREPHRVARFAEELAGLYHRWYDACRVVPQGEEPVGTVNRTRLWLNDATGQVLRTALTTVGVSSPERM